jgi:hypothetical protein
LTGVAELVEMRALLQRPTGYPYAIPEHSFVQVGKRTLKLPAAEMDLAGRTPLLAYGSNAAPEALVRKLATVPDIPLPVLRAELADFDVVYSAHISPYGSVPAALRRSAGTTVTVHVAYPADEQLPLLSASEPNYELARLRAVSCRLDGGPTLSELDAFVSRHGCLSIGRAEIALAAIEASGRQFAKMAQPQVLEIVRSCLSPELSLARFVARCAESGGLAPLPDLPSP